MLAFVVLSGATLANFSFTASMAWDGLLFLPDWVYKVSTSITTVMLLYVFKLGLSQRKEKPRPHVYRKPTRTERRQFERKMKKGR